MVEKNDLNNNNIDDNYPTSVKKQLWDNSHLIYFKFNEKYYFFDKRYDSPYNFEYDLWHDGGKDVIQSRIIDIELVTKLTNFINRSKKIKKILDKIQ
jgi:hypothetical protein